MKKVVFPRNKTYNNGVMIQNSDMYIREEKRRRVIKLKKLSLKKGIRHMEELLRLGGFSRFRGQSRSQPLALAKILKSLRCKQA